MTIIYDKKHGQVVDTEEGLELGLNSWLDEGEDMGLRFSDPSQDASAFPTRWFDVPPHFIYGEPDPSKPRKRTVIGFKVRNVGAIGSFYYRNDAQKYARARQFIVRALSFYLSETDGIEDPQIEFG